MSSGLPTNKINQNKLSNQLNIKKMKTYLNATIKKETEKASLIEMLVCEGIKITFWLPKSQISNIDIENNRISASDWTTKNAYEAFMKTEHTAALVAVSAISKYIIN